MHKFRKKPVEVEAVQWMGSHEQALEIQEWAGREAITYVDRPTRLDYIEINTLEGSIYASAGDYIIKGVAGEFYPCKPDIFEQTYEEVTDGSSA